MSKDQEARKDTGFLSPLVETLLESCRKAEAAGEVPVSALVFRSPKSDSEAPEVLATAENRILTKHDPSAHAELEAIRMAAHTIGNERLSGYSLLSALEPCLMCSGAVIHARLDAVYYLSALDKGPGLRWVLGTSHGTPMRTNHYPELICLYEYRRKYQELLRSFFEKKR